MEATEGQTIFFTSNRKIGHFPVFTATVGKAQEQDGNDSTRYIYIRTERMAIAVHDVSRVRAEKERFRLQCLMPDMPDAVFIDGRTARSINSRRKGNTDCQCKGCYDRYSCIWFNTDSEKDSHGKTRPWNKIPQSHRIGDEKCPRFFDKKKIKVNKRKRKKHAPPPKPQVILYSIE